MTPKRARLTALVALPLASFVAAGAFAAHAQGAHEAAPTPGSQRTPDSAPSVVLSEPADAPTWATSNFPRNAAGLTYGSDSDAKDEAGVPDLIAAMATNGAEGFVKKTDMERADPDPSTFSSPQEALAWQAKMVAAGPIQIPVYDLSGTKQIGVFRIGIGDAVEGGPSQPAR